MSSPIELLTVELARPITIHLHPEWLPNLLSASHTLRRLFAPSESELSFVAKHLSYHFEKVEAALKEAEWTTRLEMAANVPFRRLPDVYAIAWIVRCWDYMTDPVPRYNFERTMDSIVIVFPDVEVMEGSFRLAFRLGPHRPVAWMERILLKALGSQSVQIKFFQECRLVFSLAALLDSVAIAEVALQRLFAQRMKCEVSVTGASEVVLLAQAFRYFFLSESRGSGFIIDTDDNVQDNFAWCMASVAEEAVENGAVHLLEYALQHPLMPVAFSYCMSDFNLLIHSASKHAHMHIIHYLLGNPLPLAPPPAHRPIRPGDLSCTNDPEEQRTTQWRNVALCRENPLAHLTQCALDDEPPVQHLLRFTNHDPLRAATYLLDQGAPPNRLEQSPFGPLHRAAQHGCPGIVRLLVERGANVDDRTKDGLTPLHMAAKENNPESVLELLECGADRDAGVEVQCEDEDEEENELECDFCDDFDVCGDYDHLGWTPLNFAVKGENHDVARVLLKAGATVLIRKEEEDGDDVHIDSELRKQLLR
ncbi:hypothetical protein HDU96_007107 [Phlyctochytrium bullatum]|nr:hypothetical protein HDU96_007107 [Phlyctochytrium bullatum]